MSIMLIRADARRLPLAAGSVDLIATSPPYLGLRDYSDNGEKGYEGQIGTERTPQEFVTSLVECTREMTRVLTPGGSIFVNLGDAYASYPANRGDGRMQKNTHRPAFERGLSGGGAVRNKSLMLIPERYRIACVDELKLIVRAVVIWNKPNPMPGGRLRDRVRTTHEDWVHLTKTDRHYFNASGLLELGGGQMPPSVQPVPVSTRLAVPDHIAHARCCGGVRVNGCRKGLTHCATFPVAWPRWCITGWCPPGGTVLDPFGGAGTTAMVADVMGCRGITVDLSADYGAIARWRVHDPRERARAAGPTRRPVGSSTETAAAAL